MPSSESRNNAPTFAQSLAAGGIAGTTVDVSLYPIDTLKTRLQSSKGFLASGGFTGVYRGIGSAVVGSAPGAGLFFVTYEKTKAALRQRSDAAGRGTEQRASREAAQHMLAASLGEIAACAVRVPTEVVKQRAQASQRPTSLGVLQNILGQWRTKGVVHVWRELYRGWGVTVLREVPFTVIQFPLWEWMKTRRSVATGQETTASESALFGAISGAVAAALTTPLDVLKTRMMLATTKQSLVPLTRQIWSESGPKAFLAGIGPRVLWISAGGAVFLGSYQWALDTVSVVL